MDKTSTRTQFRTHGAQERARRDRVTRFALATLGLSLATVAARQLRRAPQRERSLEGKVIVITGASSGMGRAIALKCVTRGAKVVLAARHEEGLERVASEARSLGGEALAVVTDVAERQQVVNLVNAAVAHYGRIDVMMNHAGEWFIDSVEHSDEKRVRNLIDVNVMGVLYGVQAALPIMRRQGFGHIINTSSVEGRVGFPFTGVYAGTKAFVELMTQSLRQELMHVEGTPIKVSTLLPPTVRTPLFDDVPNIAAGGRGAHMIRPVIEATQAADAVVDAIEHYRPIIYPLSPIKGMALLYDLLPGVAERLMSHMRPDRHVNLSSHAERGSHRDKEPIPPIVEGGRLRH